MNSSSGIPSANLYSLNGQVYGVIIGPYGLLAMPSAEIEFMKPWFASPQIGLGPVSEITVSVSPADGSEVISSILIEWPEPVEIDEARLTRILSMVNFWVHFHYVAQPEGSMFIGAH